MPASFSSLITKAFFVAQVSLAGLTLAEKEGNVFHPVMSWTGPLDDQDFKNWELRSSSVALNNKLVLAPNGDQNGFIGSKWVSLIRQMLKSNRD